MPHFKKDDTRLLYEYICSTAPNDMVMLDIGARTGKWLVPFVDNFTDGTFHCFEALPEQYDRLSRRYKKHNNVNCYNTVVSDNKEDVVFYRDLDRKGWSGLRKHSYIESFEEVTLQSNIIDSYDLKPYFIKIDVEGAELLALKGCENTLQTTQVIYFECNEIHFKEYNYTAADLYNFITKKGFVITTVYQQVLSEEEFCYMTEDKRRYEDPKGYQSNFLAVKNV